MKVLIATDGSEYSSAAAAKFCELYDGVKNLEVRVVSVYENSQVPPMEPFILATEHYLAMTEAAKDQALHFATSTAEQIAANVGELNITAAAVSGKPSAVIVEEATEWNADLIIVGSHGRGFWGRMLGSVSNGVVNHAPCSVLVVRAETDPVAKT